MRKNLTVFGLILVILTTTNSHQAISQTQQETSAETAKPQSGLVLLEDTPIKLRLMQTLSSGTSKVNDKVDFEVVEAVKVGDVVVIPQGETAMATVTEARSKKSFGRSGKLNVNIDYVRLPGGDKAMLRAVKGGSGGSRTGVMTTAVVATAIVFFPAAPLFFLHQGQKHHHPEGDGNYGLCRSQYTRQCPRNFWLSNRVSRRRTAGDCGRRYHNYRSDIDAWWGRDYS